MTVEAATDIRNAVEVSVRCDGDGSSGTLFAVPGIGGGWLVSTPPLWSLPKFVPGLRVCSYTRGSSVNGTTEAVPVAAAHVSSLIEHVTSADSADKPLYLLGHSYG